MSNPIDEYFKKNLADVEVQPRKDLFAEKIAPRIEQRKAGYFFSPWLRVAAAVVLLLGAWQMLQIVNTPQPENIVFPEEKPIAVEQPKAIELPLPTSEVKEFEADKAAPIRKATQNTGGLVSTTAAGNAPKNLQAQAPTTPEVENTQVVAAETKTSYKVKLRIDPAKYATKAQVEEEPIVAAEVEETQTFTEYAAAQFDNIKGGDKLESPPKEWFELPKLAVRMDGNPLKKMLPGKE